MKRTKRFLAILLCLASLASMSTGCGQEEAEPQDTSQSPSETGKTEELEFMEISVSGPAIDEKGESDYIIDTIEEKFNVDFVPRSFTWDDYSTKTTLWASTGDLPDWNFADMRHGDTFIQWINDEIIRPLPSDLSAWPNVQEYLQGETAKSCMYDDRYYALYRMSYLSQTGTVGDRMIYYRWDLAQAAGIEKEPETYEEFIAMLEAIVEADPEGKKIGGITLPERGYLNHFFACYNNPQVVNGGKSFRWERNEDGSYVPSYFKGKNLGDEMLPVFQLARDMFTKGLIDPDIALMNDEQCINKFLSGQMAAACTTGSWFEDVEGSVSNTWEDMYGTAFEDSIKVLNLLPSKNGETYYWDWDCAWSESVFSSDVDDAKMERILMIADWMLSDEGLLLTKYGKEGEDYTIAEDGTIEVVEGVDLITKYPSYSTFRVLVSWVAPFKGDYKLPSNKMKIYDDEILPSLLEQAEACNNPETYSRCIEIFKGLDVDFGIRYTDDLILIMTGSEPVEDMWRDILEQYKEEGLEDIIQKVNDAMK